MVSFGPVLYDSIKKQFKFRYGYHIIKTCTQKCFKIFINYNHITYKTIVHTHTKNFKGIGILKLTNLAQKKNFLYKIHI